MNYYRRYPGDYMRDTVHLSILEHGAYTLLLDACYASGKPLPADYDALYRMCRAMTKPEQEAVKAIADEFFPVAADSLRHNARVDRELEIAKAGIEKMAELGRRGAAKRWGTPSSEDSAGHNVENGARHIEGYSVEDSLRHGVEDGVVDSVADSNPTTNHQPPAFHPPRSKDQNYARPARNPVDNFSTKSKPAGNGKWWETEEATLAEATARGIQTRPGESWSDLRQRIRAAPRRFSDTA